MCVFFVCFLFPGERRRKAVCVRKSDHLEVSDQRCERLPRPIAIAEPCNTDCEIRYASLKTQQWAWDAGTATANCWLANECLASLWRRWHVAGKSECSAKCGPGFRSLDVQCMKYSLMKRQSERVEASACGNSGKPPAREPCHGDCLLKSWQYSAWSQVRLKERSSPVRYHSHQWQWKIVPRLSSCEMV